jgi:orotate phosphoribosyltransferase
VIVVEDVVTAGRPIVNCVRARRAAETRCHQVAAIYAADDPEIHARLPTKGVRLLVALICEPGINAR